MFYVYVLENLRGKFYIALVSGLTLSNEDFNGDIVRRSTVLCPNGFPLL